MIYNDIKWSNSNGYWINGTHGLLHRYIWTQHNGEIPEGYDIHHRNEDKTDNEISNLELIEHGEHARLHSTGRVTSEETKQKISKSHIGMKVSEDTKCVLREVNLGENNPSAKLTTIDVIAIKTWLLLGYRQKDIAEVFGISSTHISMINTGKKWSHIGVR